MKLLLPRLLYSFCLFMILAGGRASADILGDLSVQVLQRSDKRPVTGVTVTIARSNSAETPLIQVTDETGTARFAGLPIGNYSVQAEKEDWNPSFAIAAIRENATSELALLLSKSGEELSVRVKAERLLMNSKDPNGSSTYKNRIFMQERMANDHSLQSVANLSPGVTLDSQGLLHFRGEHRSMSIAMDGVVLPIPLQSQIGSLVDPNFLEEVEVRTGSYDPTFGGQLGGVLNLVTRKGGATPMLELQPEAGDHGIAGLTGLGGGSSADNRFTYFFGAQTHHSNLRLEPPTPDHQSLNNQGDDANSLLRLGYHLQNNELNLTLATQNLRFNIPNAPIAQLAGVNQWQRENNILGVFSWRRGWSPATQMLFGLSFLSSHQAVGNNGAFTPWTVAYRVTMPNANAEGLPQNPEDPGSPFLPTLSRSGSQKLAQLILTHQFSGNNTLRVGGTANFTHLEDNLDITDAGGAGTLPNGVRRYLASDNRNGFNGGLFAGDFLKLTPALTANVGARLDRYNNGVNVSAMQISPLFNFAYSLSSTQVIRWSYERLFSAPPLEPDPTGSTNVVPQKTTAYEVSWEAQPSKDLVTRLGGYVKNYRDALDLALLVPLSNLPVFVPVNFPQGQTVGVELSAHTDRPEGFNWFSNFSGTSMHILQPQPGTTQIPLVDHFENALVTFGASYQWKNGAYASLDNKYGSGFPQDAIKAYNADGVYPFGIHGTTSRFLTNLKIGWKPEKQDQGVGGSLQVLNLFNCKQVINLLSNFSGTRFVQERRILFTLDANF